MTHSLERFNNIIVNQRLAWEKRVKFQINLAGSVDGNRSTIQRLIDEEREGESWKDYGYALCHIYVDHLNSELKFLICLSGKNHSRLEIKYIWI